MLDFGLTEAQAIAQRSFRAVLREETSLAFSRGLERSGHGYDPALYRRLGDLGWFGLLLPEDLGGQGGAWVEAALLYEELGRAALPGPHFASMSATLNITRFGAAEQKSAVVPALLSGERTAAPAFRERSAQTDTSLVETRAARDGGTVRVSGTKLSVEFGDSVDKLLVTARVEGGVGLALVDRTADGVLTTRVEAIGGEPKAVVRFDSAPAEWFIPLSENDLQDLDRLSLRLRLLRAAELLGISTSALDLAIAYAKTRVQYGRPIGSFQALQHKLANAATRVELARWPVYYAAWRLAEGIEDGQSLAGAILKAGEMGQIVTGDAVQTHGGLGVIDGSDVSLYYRRAKARQLELGYPDKLLEPVAEALGI
jgi:alkylation response protein AidB-like acyl-CoA dehydrogenase